MNNGNVIFVAGVYGVGKSTLCDALGRKLNIPSFSAGDLISEINGEIYGRNKAVKDKFDNQDKLISAVNKKILEYPSFLLAGHFCIFNEMDDVEILPEYVFEKMPLSLIVILEADVKRINQNLCTRDNRKYSDTSLKKLIEAERHQCEKIAARLEIPLILHEMKFDSSDVECLYKVIAGGQKS